MSNSETKTKSLALILGVLVMSFFVSYFILAWTEPAQSPPEGNVPTPINVGLASQTKAGSLNILGNVGIGTETPEGAKLEVVGNVKLGGATPTYKITNVVLPTEPSDVATKEYVDSKLLPTTWEYRKTTCTYICNWAECRSTDTCNCSSQCGSCTPPACPEDYVDLGVSATLGSGPNCRTAPMASICCDAGYYIYTRWCMPTDVVNQHETKCSYLDYWAQCRSSDSCTCSTGVGNCTPPACRIGYQDNGVIVLNSGSGPHCAVASMAQTCCQAIMTTQIRSCQPE